MIEAATGKTTGLGDGRQATQWLWGKRGTLFLRPHVLCVQCLRRYSRLLPFRRLLVFLSRFRFISPAFFLVEQSSPFFHTFALHPLVAQSLPSSRLPQIHFSSCPGGHLLSFFATSLLLPLYQNPSYNTVTPASWSSKWANSSGTNTRAMSRSRPPSVS